MPAATLASAESDAALVVAIARGERAALAVLYDRHAGALLAIALRIVRERREAEDVLHDVFLEVWRAAGDYDPGRGRVHTWLAIRTRSRALDRVKAARTSRRADDDRALDELVASDRPDRGPDERRVREAVAALPAEQRRVLELAYFDGRTCSEIAALIAVPIGTVKSRLAAALNRLRAAIGGREEERG